MIGRKSPLPETAAWDERAEALGKAGKDARMAARAEKAQARAAKLEARAVKRGAPEKEAKVEAHKTLTGDRDAIREGKYARRVEKTEAAKVAKALHDEANRAAREAAGEAKIARAAHKEGTRAGRAQKPSREMKAAAKAARAAEQNVQRHQDKLTRRALRQAEKLAIIEAVVLPPAKEILDAVEAAPTGEPLSAYARTFTSQHGEDGIVLEILRRAGMPTRRCVELACGANGGNSGALAAIGYKALMFEANEVPADIARRLFADQDVSVVSAWITPEGFNDLLIQHGFVGEVDHFGLDIDGFDYWVFKNLKAIQPLLVVAEYNQLMGPEAAVTIPYIENFNRKETNPDGTRRWSAAYFGVSLSGLVNEGRRKGYRLVAVHACNAFLLREDVAPEIPEISPRESWVPNTRGNYARMTSEIAAVGPHAYFDALDLELVDIP